LPSYELRLPVKLTAGFGTATTALNAVPELFWQFVQWHTPTKIGSASPEYLTLPHRHPPSIFIVASCSDWRAAYSRFLALP
jgi:hypothetical protein